MLQQAYGEDCLSRTQRYEWYQHFKSGRPSIEDDPKSGRPSSSTGDDHIEKVHSVICENSRLTVREVSEEVGICKSSCHKILTEKLKMHRVAAKFVASSADRGTKTEPRHSQLGAIRSFEY
jgi:histone-lysine N-methyltransferase SETMAR